MAQPQIPAPEYPQPAEVPAEKRLAPTPERSGFFVPDEINGTDPLDDVRLNRQAYPQLDTNISPVPLRNEGTECYRNSVLHSLFSIDHFLNLVNYGYEMTSKQIYRNLKDAAERFRTKSRQNQGAEAPIRTFMELIRSGGVEGPLGASERYEQEDQEDAVHFLHHLLHRLCFSEIPADVQPEDAYEIPVFKRMHYQFMRLFGCRIMWRRVYQCDHGKQRVPITETDMADPFALSVNSLQNNTPLEQLISERMYQPGALGGAGERTCPHEVNPHEVCNADAIGMFGKLDYLPEVLPIQIDYHEIDDYMREQANFTNRAIVPETLDMSKLTDSNDDIAKCSTYRLQAAILYSGYEIPIEGAEQFEGIEQTEVNGHYISYIRRGNTNTFLKVDDNVAALESDYNKRREGSSRVETHGFDSIHQERDFQPRIMFYVRERPLRSRTPPPQDAGPGNDDEQRRRDEAAAQRAQEARDSSGLTALALERARRRGQADSYSNQAVDVRHVPTRYRGATQAGGPQQQGRCNCGGPRAQAGRGGSHQGAAHGGHAGGGGSGEASVARAAMRASMRGGAADDDDGDHAEEDAEEEEDATRGGATGANNGGSANNTGGGNVAGGVTFIWPRGPPEVAQMEPFRDMRNVGTWPHPDFVEAYYSVFGKKPPGQVRKGEAVERDRPTSAGHLRRHFDLQQPQDWGQYSQKYMRDTIKSRNLPVPGGKRSKPFIDLLEQNDQTTHADNLKGAQLERDRQQRQGTAPGPQNTSGGPAPGDAPPGPPPPPSGPPDIQRPEQPPPPSGPPDVQRPEQPPPPSGPPDVQRPEQPPPPSGPPGVQRPERPPGTEDQADQDLVDGIETLERLIRQLEGRSCGCPLNGLPSLPVEGMRNGRGTPHRALRVVVTIPRDGEGKDNHAEEFWIPLAPELDTPGMRLARRAYVFPMDADTRLRRVRIELSGPEAEPADPDESFGSGRTTLPEFMNWVEILVDFDLTADDVKVVASQDDMPAVPLVVSRAPPPPQRPRRSPPGRGGGGSGGGGGPGGGGGGPGGDDNDDGDNGDGDQGGGIGKREDKGKQPEVPPPAGGKPLELLPGNQGNTTQTPATPAMPAMPAMPATPSNQAEENITEDTIEKSRKYFIAQMQGKLQQQQGKKTGSASSQNQTQTTNPNDSSVTAVSTGGENTTGYSSGGTTAVSQDNTTGSAVSASGGSIENPRGASLPGNTSTTHDSWLQYEESLRDQSAVTSSGGGSGVSGVSGSGHKRKASDAGIDDGRGTPGGDSSRPRVGSQTFASDFPQSPSFMLGTTDVSTPARLAVQQFQPKSAEEQRRLDALVRKLYPQSPRTPRGSRSSRQ